MQPAEGKAPITARDVLAYATIEGARANGLDAKVGSLTPGKQADIIMLRTDRMNVTPLGDPATAVVTSMDTGNVDTVLIAGRVILRVSSTSRSSTTRSVVDGPQGRWVHRHGPATRLRQCPL